MARRYFYIFFLILFLSKVGIAQQYSFKRYGIEEGLAQAQVNSILQDKRGILWVGTPTGVYRFNGSKFYHINATYNLQESGVKKLHEGKKGYLWYFTSMGIYKMQGIKPQLIKAEKNALNKVRNYEVVECNQTIWVLVQKDKQKSKLYYLEDDRLVDFNQEHNFDEDILSIHILKNDDKLISTPNGLYQFDGKVLKKSPLQSIVQSSKVDLEPKYVDSKGSVWFKPKSGNDNIYVCENGLLRPIQLSKARIGNKLWRIMEDSQGDFWLSFGSIGVFKLDRKLREILFLNKGNGLPDNYIYDIYEDDHQHIWFGSLVNGLLKFEGTTFVKYTAKDGLDDQSVWSILEDYEGNIWFGTNSSATTSGLCKLSPDGTLIQIPNGGHSINGLYSIVEYPKGKFLIASLTGLWQYDGHSFAEVSQQYGIPNGTQINALSKAPNGDLLIVPYNMGGIRYHNGKTTHFTAQTHQLSNDNISDMELDDRGNIWFVSSKGIDKWDGKKMIHLSDIFVNQVIFAKDDTPWFASFKGVLRYFDNHIEVFNKKNGLISNAVFAIHEDQNKNIWVNTQVGISKLTLADNHLSKIENYGIADGYTGTEGNAQALYEDTKGRLWFGSVTGVTKLKPKQLEQKVPPTSKVIVLRLFHKRLIWIEKEYKKMHKGRIPWTLLPKELVLPYDQNHVTFVYETADYNAASDLLYQYKLEGLDKEWSPLNTTTEATYPYLSPGNYTFKVRSCYKDGACASDFASYSFSINPPFWRTTWFITLMVLIVILLIILLFRWRVSRIEWKKKELEHVIHNAQKELLAQNHQIKQREIELQQLNTTKDKFFSILAHDIKGPVNSLKGFLSIMTNHANSMSADEIQYMSARLNNSVNNLSDLLSNLLSWSRSQMGVMEVNPQNIDLHKKGKDNIQLLDMMAANKEISLINLIKEGTQAYADPNTVKTVIRNLISNAIKFTEKGGKIEIDALQVDDKIQVSIKDNGLGMTKNIQDKLFKVGTKVTTKGTANEMGTGLGLLLCKEFVEKNGGKIWVDSELGVGSTFFFTLPLPHTD